MCTAHWCGRTLVLRSAHRRIRTAILCTGDRSRTCNARFWRPLLYRIELRPQAKKPPVPRGEGGDGNRVASVVVPAHSRGGPCGGSAHAGGHALHATRSEDDQIGGLPHHCDPLSCAPAANERNISTRASPPAILLSPPFGALESRFRSSKSAGHIRSRVPCRAGLCLTRRHAIPCHPTAPHVIPGHPHPGTGWGAVEHPGTTLTHPQSTVRSACREDEKVDRTAETRQQGIAGCGRRDADRVNGGSQVGAKGPRRAAGRRAPETPTGNPERTGARRSCRTGQAGSPRTGRGGLAAGRP